MATNEIQGDVVGLFLSTNLVTPAWKEVVCAENTGLDATRDVNTKRVKCGVIKGFGPPAYSISGSGAFNSAPSGTQVSSNEILGYMDAETPVLVKIAHITSGSIIYREGQGQITKLTEGFNSGDVVVFDFTVDISGGLTLVAP